MRKKFFDGKPEKKSVLKIENHPKICNFWNVLFLPHENNEKRFLNTF